MKMQFKIFDWENSNEIFISMEVLIGRIAALTIKENFHEETLKCLSIIARTELARRLHIYGGCGCEKHPGCILCTEPGHCLEFGLPRIDMDERIMKAVSDTQNTIITFDGKPIKPYCHYRCGGATENSENVMGNRITYLRKVLCEYCVNAEDEGKEKFFSLEDLEKLLNVKIEKPKDVYYDIKGIFENVDIDDQGRIKSLSIGGKTFKGTEIVERLGLNSTRFNYIPVRFLISCIGSGHGLGLCITGAEEMAKRGMKHEEILNYYYTGIRLEQMEFPDESKPLKGKTIVLDPSSGQGDCYEGKGPTGLREGEVNLKLAVVLGELLQKSGARVYLTREGEEHVILSERADNANRVKPDFFLSICQSTFPNQSASGTEAYHYRDDNEAKKLGGMVLEEVSKVLGCKNRGLRTADFYILKEVKCSTLQLNLLYITNPGDEKKLADPDMMQKAAEAIARSIIKYYEK